MKNAKFLALGLLPLMIACGGGGGGGAAPAPVEVDLGLVSSSEPTTRSVDVRNPLSEEAQVTLAGGTGPFSPAVGALPQVVAGSAQVSVDFMFAPVAPGPAEGRLELRFTPTGGGTSSTRAVELTADAEAVTLFLATPTLNFGEVLAGTTADLDVTLRNDSTVSTARVTGATLPSPMFTVTSPTLPVSLAPGALSSMTVRFAPTQPAAVSGNMLLATNDPDAPQAVLLQATTGGQEVIDLGEQILGPDGKTDVLTFDVPDDAISFMIEAVVDSSAQLGLCLLTGPGGVEFENAQLSGAYLWRPSSEGIFTAMVPNTDQANVQLVAGGGQWSAQLYLFAGTASPVDVRVIVERRPGGTEAVAALDLNVWLADAIAPTAATAASDTTLQTVLGEVDTLLAQQGIRLGDVAYYDIGDTAYDDVLSYTEFFDMLELSVSASETRLNLFFVRTAIGSGVLGVAATIAGPALNGTRQSGVMSLYQTSNPTFIGLVAAHEIGHFVGLGHTVEQTGAWDNIDDTANCPSSGTDLVCPIEGGGYLMHWEAVGGVAITNGQGLVIRGHPLMEATLLPEGSLLRAPTPPPIFVDPGEVSPHWCGTCRVVHPPKGGR